MNLTSFRLDCQSINRGKFGTDDYEKRKRGKGKPSLAQTGDEEDDSQKRNGDAIDCDDYEDADLADTPKECQEDSKVGPKDTSTSSSSGKGNDKADKPNRGKKN